MEMKALDQLDNLIIANLEKEIGKMFCLAKTKEKLPIFGLMLIILCQKSQLKIYYQKSE